MKLPILYSRTSTGAIQEWEIEVDGDKYRTISGQVGGAKVISEFTVCKGKNIGRANETTGSDQSLKEATSKWEKKKKTGYFEDIKSVDSIAYVEPMLAKNFKDRKDKVVYPCWVDRKYNGMRQITTKQGAFTRKGEKIVSAPHIVHNLNHLFVKHPDLVLDGELYNHDYRFRLNEIISLVRKTVNITRGDLDESASKIKYYVYDGYGFDGVTEYTKFSQRKTALKKLLVGIPCIAMVESFHCIDEQDILQYYHSFLSDGYEGAIVRIDGAYEHKRSSNLLKVKPVEDDEFVIVDVVEGDGNRTGVAGKVICKMKDGRTFGANMKGEMTQFAEVLKNKHKYIGKVATIQFNGKTGFGIPNYAQFDCDAWNKGDR